MKNLKTLQNPGTRRSLPIACATALTVAFAVSLPQSAHAGHVTPPPVPDGLQVEAGNKAFLVGHAEGTQNYICLPSGTGFKFILFTPQATLFNDDEKQVTTHYFSPNLSPIPPEEPNTIRATWQHSRDSSTVWARMTNSAVVTPDAIPWLLLKVVGSQDGPTGGHKLTETTFIQRLNTSGGVAPTGCESLTDVGKQAFVPYTADYFFYKKVIRKGRHYDN